MLILTLHTPFPAKEKVVALQNSLDVANGKAGALENQLNAMGSKVCPSPSIMPRCQGFSLKKVFGATESGARKTTLGIESRDEVHEPPEGTLGATKR